MKLRDHMRVDYETAKQRALAVLDTRYHSFANSVAGAIWPNHEMKSQGAGAAASRILKRMEKEGLVSWSSNDHTWGWLKTKGKG